MPVKYFSTAWQDIKNSPGWIGKMLLLALLMFIPVFGWIVVAGYLLGWARDIAWGVHAPLPEHVFGNEDGHLYPRGFFAWIISIVFFALVAVVTGVLTTVLGIGSMGGAFGWHHGGGVVWRIGTSITTLLAVLGAIVVPIALAALGTLFEWVGWMRVAVYGRLSAGLQIGRVWAMIRHDAGGILRIFGMNALLYVLLGVVATVVACIVAVAFMLGAVVFGSGLAGVADVPSFAIWLIVLALAFCAAVAYAGMVFTVFTQMMVIRALGHWTRQFDVPHWRGQDDPMPFEARPAA